MQRLDRSPAGLAAYRASPGAGRSSPTSTAPWRAGRWERVPYREVPYAEDQLLGRELIEAGYAKVFHPERAPSLHSHDYPPAQFLRRYFDEFRVAARGARPRRARRARAQRSARSAGCVARRRALAAPRTACTAASSSRPLARLRPPPHDPPGGRDPRLARRPAAARRAPARCRSRAATRFVPADVPASPLARRDERAATARRRRPNRTWAWEFIRTQLPDAPARARAPHRPRRDGPMTLAWVVPPWKVGSGGHTTIFRLIRQLEQRGHRCAIYVFDPFNYEPPAGRASCARRSATHFIPVEAQVFKGLDEWTRRRRRRSPPNWWTAWPLRDLPGCREKAYLVQDDEPQFYATSAQRIWAAGDLPDGLPRHRLHAVDGGHPRARLRHARRAGSSAAPTSTRTRSAGEDRASRDSSRSTRGARPSGARSTSRWRASRRCSSAGPASASTLFGSERRARARRSPRDEPRRARRRRELAALYRRASAGVVFSLTTHSLVAQEMMASGLPLVELDGRQRDLGARRAPASARCSRTRRPDAIADALERRARRPDEAAAMARRARGFVEGLHLGARRRPGRGGAAGVPGRAVARAAGAAGAPAQPPAAEAGEQEHDGAARDGRAGVGPLSAAAVFAASCGVADLGRRGQLLGRRRAGHRGLGRRHRGRRRGRLRLVSSACRRLRLRRRVVVGVVGRRRLGCRAARPGRTAGPNRCRWCWCSSARVPTASACRLRALRVAARLLHRDVVLGARRRVGVDRDAAGRRALGVRARGRHEGGQRARAGREGSAASGLQVRAWPSREGPLQARAGRCLSDSTRTRGCSCASPPRSVARRTARSPSSVHVTKLSGSLCSACDERAGGRDRPG